MQGHPDWKKLKYGPPENEDFMTQMFEHIAVDGSTSCAPGEFYDVENHETEVDGIDGVDFGTFEADCDAQYDEFASPFASGSKSTQSKRGVSTQSKKRASPTVVNSPLKRSKNPMVKVMNKIHNTLEINCNISNKVMLGEYRYESIKQCMEWAVECGATEGSLKHFMATQLLGTCSQMLRIKNKATHKTFKR
jgi:hypothetical protein